MISLTRWTIKWTMMSKKAGGKYISNWHNIIAASFSNSFNFTGSRTLLHMALKKKHSRVMANLTLLSKMSRMDELLVLWVLIVAPNLKLVKSYRYRLEMFIVGNWLIGSMYVKVNGCHFPFLLSHIDFILIVFN